jgi:hypothetical protein
MVDLLVVLDIRAGAGRIKVGPSGVTSHNLASVDHHDRDAISANELGVRTYSRSLMRV